MSYNNEPEREAKRHPAPIIAIVVALLVAVFAWFWWVGSDPAEEGDVTQTEAPATPTGQAAPDANMPAGTDAPATDTPASPPAN